MDAGVLLGSDSVELLLGLLLCASHRSSHSSQSVSVAEKITDSRLMATSPTSAAGIAGNGWIFNSVFRSAAISISKFLVGQISNPLDSIS